MTTLEWIKTRKSSSSSSRDKLQAAWHDKSSATQPSNGYKDGSTTTSHAKVAALPRPQQVLLQRLPDNSAQLEHLLSHGRAHHRHQWTLLRLRLSIPRRAHHLGHSDHRWHFVHFHHVCSPPHIVQRPGHHTESLTGWSGLHREADRGAECAQQSHLSAASKDERDFRARTDGQAEILLHVQDLSAAEGFALQPMWQLRRSIRPSLWVELVVSSSDLIWQYFYRFRSLGEFVEPTTGRVLN